MSLSERQKMALEMREKGVSRAEIAAHLGISVCGVKSLLERARLRVNAGEGVTEALDRLKLEGGVARDGWLKDKGASVRFVLPRPADDPQNWVDAIRDGLQDIRPPAIKPASNGDRDLCAIFPVADLHVGLLTDSEEVGEDWDTKKAQKVFSEVFGRLVAVTPAADVAILAQLGDLTHVDDQRNVTPQSGHQLDADTRFFQILRRAVASMKWAIDTLRKRYPKVIYRGCRGNHDLTAHHAVTLALAEHYRGVDGVEIVVSANEFFVYEFGANMLLLHHGDRAKPDRLAHFAAAEWPEIWGRTRYRLALSGHVHHMRRVEIGGMALESVGTIIPRDAYAYSNGYAANRNLVSITLHRQMGEISRARVAI